jgi:hypothetical protein
MIAGLDSAQPPSAAQIAAARAAGIRLWSGYLASIGQGGSAFRLMRVWTQAEFEVARTCGGTPIAFCSGLDNPILCRALAQDWNVRLCLDVESGIRGDGPWVQGWLDASEAGLYGNLGVHLGRHAAFHVLAFYPGTDPRTVWVAAGRPPGPAGWQWQGSHVEFGAEVDRGWYDDWFGGGDDVLTQDEHNWLQSCFTTLAQLQPYLNNDVGGQLRVIEGSVVDGLGTVLAAVRAQGEALAAVKAELDALKAEIEAGGQVDAAAAVARLETALKAAGTALGGA